MKLEGRLRLYKIIFNKLVVMEVFDLSDYGE